jgi:hypothetical protein
MRNNINKNKQTPKYVTAGSHVFKRVPFDNEHAPEMKCTMCHETIRPAHGRIDATLAMVQARLKRFVYGS